MVDPIKKNTPPRAADRFLGWFCREELLEEIQGDLQEFYREELENRPRWQAGLLYWFHVLHFLRPFALKRKVAGPQPLSMYRNYFKYAFRNIRSHSFFSLINVSGLGIGLAACLLISQFLIKEWNYDKFHRDYAHIYRIQQEIEREGVLTESATTFSSMAPVLQATYPGVIAGCRLHRVSGSATVEYENQIFREENLLGVDSSFFSLFQFPFLQGNPETALQAPNTVVITESIAQKYFGDQDALGREIIIDGAYGFWSPEGYQSRNTYTISGVIRDLPENTHLRFDFLISLNLYTNLEREVKNWGDSFYTYLKLSDPGQTAVVRAGLSDIISEYRPDQDIRLHLQPMQQIHLQSDLVNEIAPNGSEKLNWLLMLVAGIILLIAGTNYINFSTARALNRWQEVEIRKVFGAGRSQLFQQLFVESFLLNVLAVGFAFSILYISRPLWTGLLGFSLYERISDPVFWLSVFALLLAATLISGVYPAIKFSRLFSKRGSGSKIHAGPQSAGISRQFLVVFQFSISLLVIGCALIMYRQLHFMHHKDLGIAIEETLVVNGPSVGLGSDSLYAERLNSFKQEAIRITGIERIALANFVPGKEIRGTATGYVRRLGTPEQLAKSYSFTQVDFAALPNFGTDLLAGRMFDPAYASDLSFGESVIINREAARLLGFPNEEAAIGQKIIYRSNTTPTVVGVIDNFHQFSLQRNFQPIIFEPNRLPQSFYYLRFTGSTDRPPIPELQSIWEKQFPGNAFSYFFLDDFYDRQYQSDQQFMRAFGLFAGLAVVVASLGFFGLVYYSAQRRIREIGIRKTFGAAYWDVFFLLGKGLGSFLLLAVLFSLPPMYLLASNWLDDYAFRIEIRWWMGMLPVLLLLGITVLVVLFQSVRSYRLSPMEVLREE